MGNTQLSNLSFCEVSILKEIPIIGGKQFIIDDNVYDKVKDYTFYTGFTKFKGKAYPYIYALISKNPKRKISLRKLLFGEQACFVHYINGDIFDNRLCNITDVDVENYKRKSLSKGDGTKYVGVNRVERKNLIRWEALVIKRRKEYSIIFDSEVKAAIGVNILFRKLFNIDYDINPIEEKDLIKYYDDVYCFVQIDLKQRKSAQRQGLKIKLPGATSKYIGVHLYINGLFVARITKYGTRYHLGYFETEEDAAHAYDNKAIELFGEKARTNF